MNLFPNIHRTETRGAYPGEHTYFYLQLSSRPEANDVRGLLEKCWHNYPLEEKNGFLTRIKDTRVINSDAAIFELILHEMLLVLNFKVQIHPILANSKKHPDFLVYDNEGNKFYLEAIVSSEYDQDQKTNQNVINLLFKTINNKFKNVLNVNLWISIIKQTSRSLVTRKLFKDIEFKLAHILVNGEQKPWIFKDSISGWEIELTLRKSNRQGGNFISVIYPQIAQLVTTADALRKAIKKKATRYNELEYPYVIAINMISLLMEEIDEVNALFGDELICDSYNGQTIRTRSPNGAWGIAARPKNTRISGVWIFDNLSAWNLKKRHQLYLNPAGQLPLSEKFYALLPYTCLLDEQLESNAGSTIYDLLNIDWQWTS